MAMFGSRMFDSKSRRRILTGCLSPEQPGLSKLIQLIVDAALDLDFRGDHSLWIVFWNRPLIRRRSWWRPRRRLPIFRPLFWATIFLAFTSRTGPATW